MNQLFVAFLNQRANMEKLSKENKELRKTNFELSEAVKELKQNQDMLLGSIKGDVIQRLKVENFDFHSEYVEFLWEIENFREKSKETLNLVSPAISSGSKGYLFCFQMQSRRSKFNFAGIRFVDVSVDAMILQGPYDDILPWPCKLVCEITLIKKDKISNDTNVVNDWRGEDFNPVRKKNIFTLRTIQPEEVVINNSIFVKFKLQRYSAE